MSQKEFKSAKEMQTHELEQFLLKETPSSSITSAMKALQDKIKVLESEKNNSTTSNPPNSKDLENYQQKIIRLEEQVKFLEEQCQFARNETKRTIDQYNIDKENWNLQFEHMKRQLQKGSGAKYEKNDTIQNKKLTNDMQNQIDQLTTEAFTIRKNYENLKTTSNKKILGLEADIQRYKSKEIEFKSIIENKNKIIESLKFKLLNIENKEQSYRKKTHGKISNNSNNSSRNSSFIKSRSNSITNDTPKNGQRFIEVPLGRPYS
jgi:chromosome segregation ATPase